VAQMARIQFKGVAWNLDRIQKNREARGSVVEAL
jgi:hypothetical protein